MKRYLIAAVVWWVMMPVLYAESRSVSFPVSVRVEPRLALEAAPEAADSRHASAKDVEEPQAMLQTVPSEAWHGDGSSQALAIQIRTNRGFPYQLTQTLRQPATDAETLTLDSQHLPPAGGFTPDDPEGTATEIVYTVTAL